MSKESFNQNEKWSSLFEREFLPSLKIISGLESMSGEEHLVREFLIEKAKEMNIENETDAIGNLYFKSDQPESNIMLCAHMDKVGEAKEAVLKDDTITGRLDDALGINIILGMIKKGFRPSVLFTVQEENWFKGSQYATKQILSGKFKKPSMILVLEVSALLKQKDGPIIYVSSGEVNFPPKGIKLLDEIVRENKQRANFIKGWGNDSSVLAELPNQNIATLQVHVDDMHSPEETAAISDVKETADLLEVVLRNHQKFI